MLIDTHAHVNSEKFEGEREQIIANAKEQGLNAIINFGDTMESSAHCLELTKESAMLAWVFILKKHFR